MNYAAVVSVGSFSAKLFMQGTNLLNITMVLN